MSKVTAWLATAKATWREIKIALTRQEHEKFLARIEKLAVDAKASEDRTYKRLIEWANGLCGQIGELAKAAADHKLTDKKERAVFVVELHKTTADVIASEERTYQRLGQLAEALGPPLHALAKKVKAGKADAAHALYQEVRDVRSDTLALLALVESDNRRLDRLEIMLRGLTGMMQETARVAEPAQPVEEPAEPAEEPKKGRHGRRPILTNLQVGLVRTQLQHGSTVTEVARKYHVSRQTILRARAGLRNEIATPVADAPDRHAGPA